MHSPFPLQYKANALAMEISEEITKLIQGFMAEGGRWQEEDELYLEFNDVRVLLEKIQEREAIISKGQAVRPIAHELFPNTNSEPRVISWSSQSSPKATE